MENNVRPDPTIFVIFGAGGDLTWRKLIPALYNLHLDGWMPERIIVLGLDRVEMTDDNFRNHLQEGVDKNSRRGKVDKETLACICGESVLHQGRFRRRQVL